MGSDEVRVGVVGTGFGKRVHVPGYQAAHGMRVTAICSASMARAKEAADEAGARHAFDSFTELAHCDEVDLVSVATPPRLHAEVTAAALGAGRHVVTEKPFAMNVAEARDMAGRAHHAGVVNAAVHEMRYIPARRHLRELVRSGFLGEVRAVAGTVYADYAVNPAMEPFYYGWTNLRSEAGGFLNSLLSHHIDLVRFTFGELHDVSGSVSTTVPTRPVLPWEYRDGDPIGPETETVGTKTVDADDTAALVGRLDNGAMVTLGGSWVAHHGSGVSLQAYGGEGTLTLDSAGVVRGARRHERTFTEIPIPDRFQVSHRPGSYMVPFFTELAEDVRAAITGEAPGTPSYPTFDDALRVQEIIDTLLANAGATRAVG